MKSNWNSLSRVPLTVKMVFLTLVVGVSIWAVMDFIVNITVTNIFETQLTERLNKEVTSYRHRFGRYVYSHSNLVKLLATRSALVKYVDKVKWSENDNSDVMYYRNTPEWLPGLSTLRAIAIPRYAILLDNDGKVREVYQSSKHPLPKMLLNPSVSLIRRSSDVSYMMNVEEFPYLITTFPVFNSNNNIAAQLMLASPLDSDFLLSSQGQNTEGILIALVTGEQNRILVSSDPLLLPSGTTLESLYGQHISVRQTLYEYGDSEMNFKFTSLVPKTEVIALTETLVSQVRKYRAIIALVFIISFALITYYITRRIAKVSKGIAEFSRRITGGKQEEEQRGDQLFVLENRFFRMTEEVIKAREIIRQQAEEKTHQIVSQVHEAIITIGGDSLITSWNPGAEEVFGWKEEEVVGEKCIDIILPPQNQGLINNALDQFLETGCESMFNRQMEMLAVDCNERMFSAELSISSAKSQDECFIIVMVRDISERKDTEEALRLSEEKFSKAFSSSPVLMIISTIEEGRFIEVNETFINAFGYRRDEVIGQTSLELGIWADPHDRDALINQVKQNGAVYNYEVKLRVRSGEIINCLHSSELIEIEGMPCMLSVLLDLTDRQKLESQLLHAQKMEAVGHLAGGVAHDFNNFLTAIIGYGNILQMKKQFKEDPSLRSIMDKMLLTSEKAAGLVKSLLAFGRKQIVQLKPVDLNSVIGNIENLILRLISESMELHVTLYDKDLIVMADSGQMEQVLMNLATNARDAIRDKGALYIETGEVEIDMKFVEKHGYGEYGTYALISVTDTGSGMDEKTIEKIFEPFFTTKDMGKGTGLGMSMIFGIIKQHNGYINVESAPGKGTTIHILLPEIKTEKTSEKHEVLNEARGGTETILLAEDEQIVRDMTRDILESYGYRVIEAHDGFDAVKKFIENQDNVQMLLLDVIMPEMNGNEAYEEIIKLKPGIKTLFVSGYSEDILMRRGVNEEKVVIVYKPVTPYDLLTKVRHVLDGVLDHSKKTL